MKSELRHKLQRNALADWLVETGQSLKPYQNLIMILVIGVLALLVAYTWWSHASAEQTTQAWDDVNAGLRGNPEVLVKVADDNRCTPAGRMAAVLAADTYLLEGCELLFQNKAKALEALNKAILLYKRPELENGSPMLQERARFGLARAEECKDDLKEAARLYEEVAKNPRGAYAAEAKERISDLNNRETRQMYDDFAKFTPQPAGAATGAPTGGPAAKTPSFDLPGDRPENPGDIQFEHEFDGGEKPGAPAAPGKGASGKPARQPERAGPPRPPATGSAPAPGETKKAESKKAEPAPENPKK